MRKFGNEFDSLVRSSQKRVRVAGLFRRHSLRTKLSLKGQFNETTNVCRVRNNLRRSGTTDYRNLCKTGIVSARLAALNVKSDLVLPLYQRKRLDPPSDLQRAFSEKEGTNP